MIVRGQDEIVAQWVMRHLGFDVSRPFTAIGNTSKDGYLIGGTIFNGYHPEAGVVEMHSASTSAKWLSREMINAIFGYAFDTLACQLVVLRVSPINTRMLNIARKFGFSEYTIPRLRGKSEAEVIMTYTDDQWLDCPYRSKAGAL